MTMVKRLEKRHSIGWYGRCKKCTDLDLSNVSFRYKVDSIHKIDPTTGQSFMKWKPASRRVENDYGGGGGYDDVYNNKFKKLECGSSYVISNPNESVIFIPNYVEYGGNLTYDCECVDATPTPTLD